MYDIPFVPSLDEKVRIMVELAGPLEGKKVADLGAGDGRVVIAFAQNGAEVSGFEIDPGRALVCRENVQKVGLAGRVFIHCHSFWEANLSRFDIITVYGITSIMGRLEAKLSHEARPGCLIISNVFTFPTLTPILERENVRVYKIKSA